jgi:hypothetical protein
MSCRDNGSASAVVLSDFLHPTSALPLKDGPPAGEVAMSLLLISLLVRESPSQDGIDGDTGSGNESKRMLPCNRADRGCVASGGQHHLAGNGADSRWCSNSGASLEYFFLQYAAFLHLVQEKILEPHRASVKGVLKSCAYCFRPCRVIWSLRCTPYLICLGLDHVLRAWLS